MLAPDMVGCDRSTEPLCAVPHSCTIGASSLRYASTNCHTMYYWCLALVVALGPVLIWFMSADATSATKITSYFVTPHRGIPQSLPSTARAEHLAPPHSGGWGSKWSVRPIVPSLAPRRTARYASGPLQSNMMLGLGFDFGTSGVRINVVDRVSKAVMHEAAVPYKQQSPDVWIDGMHQLLSRIPPEMRAQINRVAVSGTSGSVLLVDSTDGGAVTRAPRMYDFSVTEEALAVVNQYAPSGHTVRSASSALAKLVMWHQESAVLPTERLCHQADFLAAYLRGSADCISDWNNALKLGYDPRKLQYPEWLLRLLQETGMGSPLPSVVRPGGDMGMVSEDVVQRYGLAAGCRLAGGTTDSIAAFIASRASQPGQAVTSLGSTVAIKILSTEPVDDAAYGVYSHRLGDMWLVGGASNVGCAVLRQENFSAEELVALSSGIDPLADPPVQYYPLTKVGERFPVNDPKMEPVLRPKPGTRQAYLHGLLHGIARVEAQGYKQLQLMGCTPVSRVYTAGGGSANAMWGRMRQHLLGVPVEVPEHTEAAYGVALLALDEAY